MYQDGPHVLVMKGAKEGIKTSQFKKTLKASENKSWLGLFSLYQSMASYAPSKDLSLHASSESFGRKMPSSGPKVAKNHI
jgi:hypothetical protein